LPVFDRFASTTADKAGSPKAFTVALAALLLWAVTGPLMGFSDTWQLVVNTATTIVTFLMVFLIQHSENKSSLAVQAKLDDLIRAVGGTNERLIAIDEQPDDVVEQARDEET
jgi:low affinity Fe/Cu permease